MVLQMAAKLGYLLADQTVVGMAAQTVADWVDNLVVQKVVSSVDKTVDQLDPQ